jgi:hypothetical protein
MPIGRNEDGVFGMTLTRIEPSAISLQVPFGVIHDSPRQSRYQDDATQAARPQLWEFIATPILQQGNTAGSTTAEARLRRLGSMVEEIGNLPQSEFGDFATRTVLANRSRTMEEVQSLVDHVPDHWRHALTRYRASLIAACRGPHASVPLEFGDSCDGAGAKQLQSFFRRFGRLLSEWPDMWKRGELARVLPDARD